MLDFILQLDTKLFLFFNKSLANPFFDAIFPVITNGTFWIIPAIIAGGLFFYFMKKKALIVIIFSLITVSISDPVCNRLIKPAFPRLRPCNENVYIKDARFLIGRKTSYSFPSSHAMNIFAQVMLFSLIFRRKRVIIPAFIFAFLIGFSRVYVGVHYPLDVFCGALFGMSIGIIVYLIYRKTIKIKIINKLVNNYT
jgi:undecaprenyl-diphosphatase